MSGNNGTPVLIPRELVAKINKKIQGTEFDSVEKFVLFVLQEVMKDSAPQDYSQEDQKRIEERLKSLGYV